MTSVETHFEAAAATYGERSAAGLWARVRARERAAVLKLLAPRAGERVIDAACGAGYYARALGERGCRVTGVDSSAAMVAAARTAGIEAICSSIEAADIEPGSADAVVCAGALEFNESLDKIFAAFARWLRPGGRVVVLYPGGALAPVYSLYHRSHGVRVHLHSREQIETAARAAGFSASDARVAGPMARCMRLELP